NHPLMQGFTTDTERLLLRLIRTGTVTIDRDAVGAHADSRHGRLHSMAAVGAGRLKRMDVNLGDMAAARQKAGCSTSPAGSASPPPLTRTRPDPRAAIRADF